MRCASLT